MAIATICSSPNPTISLPSLPTFPPSPTKTLHSLQPTSSPPSKFGPNLVSTDALSIAEAAEAVVQESAAMEAAREAVCVAFRDGRVGLDVRRKRRRKRRKGLGFLDDEEESERDWPEGRVLIIGSGKSCVLSSREEAELVLCLKEGARIEDSMLRDTEFKEHIGISRGYTLGVDVNKRSVDKVLCNTRESRERIAHAYQGLVASIASGYQGKGLSFQDLIQEGTIGLLKGAKKFDPDRGFKLSTYVYWWIKQAIIKAVARKSRLVRLPVNKCEMVAKVAEANNVLSKRLRRVPTYDEMAEFLNVNASTVRLLSERIKTPISLDKAMIDQGHMTLQEIIGGPEELIPEKLFEREMMKQGIVKLIETLTEREAEIVRLHYGLSGQTPCSYEEIGKLLKLSRERVRQINGIALSKLKHNTIVNGLKYYVV